MIFSEKISARDLAQLCRRLSIALGAGIDVRKIWEDEIRRARRGSMKRHIQFVSQAINEGQSLSQALNTTNRYFPSFFCELTAVGEATGNLEKTFEQLADHYEQRIQMRRQFLGLITWPMFQLVTTILVLTLLIVILGIIRDANPQADLDLLGFGLYGTTGLIKFYSVLAMIGSVIGFLVFSIHRGLAWTRPIQYFFLHAPFLGNAMQKNCLARFTWTFSITLESGIAIRQAIALSLRGTGNARFIDCIPQIDKAISKDSSIFEAFSNSHCFPREFLDALAVGEQSGRLPFSMQNMARQYQDQAQASMSNVIKLAGYGVWAIVAGIIIFFIARLAGIYLGALSNMGT